MDPDALLKEILDLCTSYLASRDPESADELAEKIEALDQWLLEGGFLPHRWENGRKDFRIIKG